MRLTCPASIGITKLFGNFLINSKEISQKELGDLVREITPIQNTTVNFQ